MSNTPLVPQSDWFAYVVAGLLALLGGIARAGRWVDPITNKFSWTHFSLEIVAAIVIGAVCVGVGVYYGLALPIVGALAGVGGLLGPTALMGATGKALDGIVKKITG